MMKTALKLVLKMILGLVIILGVLILLNLTKIKRLQKANTVFDADKIVYNFSHMNEAFLYQQLDGSAESFIFPQNPIPLPATVTIAGNARNLETLLETLDTTAFIVVQDGRILNEKYYKGTTQSDHRISWSVAKSFMSGLYGKAVMSGQIKSLDDAVEDYAPSLKGSAYEGATIRNVLNMASGIEFDEDYLDPKSDINEMGRVLALGRSMDGYAADLTAREVPAGERWKYVSIDTHVAAMVLRAATGKSLHQLFNETYSANLGFEGNPYYLTDGKNVAFALGGLNLTTRDYAKFGQLFLQGGEFNGKQVIPADWVVESTAHSAPNINGRGTGYGYQWWVPMPQDGPNKGDFYAVGIYGQYIYVNPARGLVIAKNAADREFTQEMEGYGHSMNVNVDMFRSLADYYAPEVQKLGPFHVLSEAQTKEMIARAGYGQDDYGEVFGLARACSGVDCPSPEDVQKRLKSIAGRFGKNGDALPSEDQLNKIWSEMLDEMKTQRPNQTPTESPAKLE